MKTRINNSILKQLLILCLSFALILSQANRLHIHPGHDEHSSAASGHIVDVHTSSILHDFELTGHHTDQHTAAIDVSPDNLINKANSLNPLVLILLFIGLFLYICRQLYQLWQRPYKILFTPCYYLIKPPLRAPPVK